MNIDLLTARRVLRAVKQGFPVDEGLLLIENLLDGFGDDQGDLDRLDSLLKASLQGATQWLEELCAALKSPVSPEEERHG